MRSAGFGFTLGVLISAVTGCATIMASGPDHIPVATNPPGATVFVDNVPVGQTPMLVMLDRKRNIGLIRIEMFGFAPVVVARTPSINGWFWANICLGSVIGIMVDLITGDIKSFDDTPISVGLVPATRTPPLGYAPPPPAIRRPGTPPPPPRCRNPARQVRQTSPGPNCP